MIIRKKTKGTCPACGYARAYSETTGKNGRLMGWCASCRDKEAIAAILYGSDDAAIRPAGDGVYDPAKAAKEAKKRREQACAIWNGAASVTRHDPAGLYLASRSLSHLIGCPALRYRDDLRHPLEAGRFHALVAGVQDATGTLVAVHRTFLAPDGRKARVEPVKASKGPIAGGAIRLAPAAPHIVIGEGIETSASAGLLLGLPAWTAVSAGNMATSLILPPEVQEVTIAADDDGQDAQGRNPGLDAAEVAARRWKAEGRTVRIMKSTQPGEDFNDILQAREAGKAVA
jgi:putative DNA primase/helicase